MTKQEFYSTIKEYKEFSSEDCVYEYKKPSVITGMIIIAHGIECPMCEADNDIVLGEDEGPVSCECGTEIYCFDDIILCDTVNYASESVHEDSDICERMIDNYEYEQSILNQLGL